MKKEFSQQKKEWGIFPITLVEGLNKEGGMPESLRNCVNLMQHIYGMFYTSTIKLSKERKISLLKRLRKEYIHLIKDWDDPITFEMLYNKFSEGIGKYGTLNFCIISDAEQEKKALVGLISACIRHYLAYKKCREDPLTTQDELEDHLAGIFTNISMFIAHLEIVILLEE